MEEPNNDIDTETLQAQIDLSMAYAQNLVSSWLAMPSSSSLTQSLPSSSRAAEAESELQTLLRRPPRLGVGAPLPETPAPAQTRLVQKLKAGKRRTRNMENGDLAETATAAMANDGRSEREGEDSAEEESRVASVSVIRKRPRIVDPFEPGGGGKNKKRVKKATTVEKTEMEETVEAAQAVETVPARDVAVEEALPMVASVDPATSPSSKKRKKKKKKKKKAAVTETQLLSDDEGEAQGAQERVVVLGEPVGEPRSGDRSAEGLAQAHSAVALPDGGPTMSPKPPQLVSSPAGPSIPSAVRQQPPTTPGTSAHPTYSPPILNLTGLPPPPPEEPEGSPHKKRRRRKRKKNKSTGEPQGAERDPP